MPDNNDMNRREFVKTTAAASAAAAVTGTAMMKTATAANSRVRYGMIGTGSRGTYLLGHLRSIDAGQCVAICDIEPAALERGAAAIRGNPQKYKDYRELLDRKDIDAVFVITPLNTHFQITKDALLSGRHVFCEKCLVFKAQEVHALRQAMSQRPKQVLQVGLQRRYSYFYQMVKDMVDKGVLGDVRHVHAQWHRNAVNTPSMLWTMKPGGRSNVYNWRLFREFSGGLTAELGSHQVDVSDWMLGSAPESVTGVGGLDTMKDGRDVYDNIQLIYTYPNGKKLTYSAISTNQFLPFFNATRSEMGEVIMGTDGAVEITVGDDDHPPIAWWYREPPKNTKWMSAKTKMEPFVAGATMMSGSGARGPIPLMTGDLALTGKEGFLERETKYARRWLYAKGIFTQEETRNPVDAELESFFANCRDLKRPRADAEIGLANSTAVILSNVAMEEGRRVYFSEFDKIPGDKS